MCRTPGGHRKIPDFILLLPPYETIFALLPIPYSVPYSCAVSVGVLCSPPYFGRTPPLSRHLSPTLARAQSLHRVPFPTRTQHLLLNLHDAHYHTHLRVIPNASQGDEHYHMHLDMRKATQLVSSNGHSGELFVFPYGWLSKDFEEGGVGTRTGRTPFMAKTRHPKNYIILHTGYGLCYLLHNLVTGERGKDSSSAKFG